MNNKGASSATVVVKKRERTQNWVPEEKSALFSLIKVHVNAIENKKIDAAASAMKTLAWQQIYCAFRGRFSTERDITRMREQWRRMKAQARIEMYTFAEKVRTLGPEEAAKSRPSNLSIEVWRLMESTKKNDCDAERSDESSQDADGSTNFQAILDKLAASSPPEISVHEIKLETNSDDYNDEDTSQPNLLDKQPDVFRKRKRISHSDEPMDLVDQKRLKTGDTVRQLHETNEDDDSGQSATSPQLTCQDEQIQRAVWIFEAAQKEHNLKLQMLNIELERAELQKQTAINELKASEIKKRLIENQAADYYRWAALRLIENKK
ncbi:uncharacterized protein LOC107264091 isoform X1 [Cephus cinctus]|uniref:Regulatory protein zeste n=1 Tax=Cephus cinctus TaxID=211228 RepID=A0AAJ7VYF3_CEPCN|nr:uncharacterized protein LOC107264091 isoform X1 [Cephus cinctus]